MTNQNGVTPSTYSGQYLKRNRDTKTGRISWYFRVDPRHRPEEWTERFGAAIRLPRDEAHRTGEDERDNPTEYAQAFKEASALWGILQGMRGQSGKDFYPRGSMRWLIEQWKKSPGFLDMAESTQGFYHKKLKHILEWTDFAARQCGGIHHPVSRMTAQTIGRFLSTYDDQPTLRGHLKSTLSLLYGFAVMEGIVDRNIVKDVTVRRRKRGESRKSKIHLWTQNSVDAFATFATNEDRPEIAALILTMWDVGQRPTDLLRLTALTELEHEAFKRGILDAGFYYNPFDETLIGWQQKTGSFIDIPLDEPTNEAIARVAPRPGSNRRHVFVNPADGEPYNVDQFAKIFRRMADKIGWTQATFRQGRHSAIVRMLSAGINEQMITAISGHDNPDMIRKKYGVGTSEMATEAKRLRTEFEGR